MNAESGKMSISEQAARWLCEIADGHREAEAQLLVWLRQSPRHVEEFLFATTTWKALRESAGQSVPDVDSIIARARRDAAANVVELQGTRPAPPAAAPAARASRHWRAAAAVALVAATGLLSAWLVINRDTYITEVGEQRTVRLKDGSVLYLNTDSRARIRFTSGQRVVRLDHGEALFDVAQESARPFKVVTAGATVQVVGTQFNVRQRDDRVVVSVLEGRVKLEDRRLPQLLDAGEEASVQRADGGIVRNAAPDIAQAVAWRDRKLVFKNARLTEVVAEINRYSHTRFSVEGEEAARTELTATFDADKPESILAFLQRFSDLEVRRAGANVLIRSVKAAGGR